MILNTLLHRLAQTRPVSPEDRITRAILDMRWDEFEGYVATLLRKMGYKHVEVTGKNGPDGGTDILIMQGNARYLAQCKHWYDDQVGVSLVREFYAVMVENGAQGGYFVTLRGFTPAAIEYASNKAIKLVDLNILVQWHRLVETRRVSLKAVEVEDPQAPRCESGVMKVKRTGPKGVFWGCGMWPKCLCKGLV